MRNAIIRFLYTLLTILLLSVVGYSQSQDSLIQALKLSSRDTSRVILLNRLSLNFREVDTNIALTYAQRALTLADSLGYRAGRGMVLENVGWIYYRKGILSKAYDNSIEALTINQKLGNIKEMAQCLNNIGAIKVEQHRYQEGIASFKQALALSTQINFISTKGRSLNNIAFCFLKLNQLDSSRYYANRSITEQSNDKFRAAFSQRLLGEILFIEGRNAESIRYYEIAMKAAIESNNNFLKASVLYRMGETYLKMGNFEKALPLLLEDQQLASRYGYNGELESTYKILIKAYAMRKDFQQAYAYQQKYTHFHDSLATFRNDDQLAILEQEHETKLKNAQIELLTKDSRLKESEIESQQILIYGVCAALFILLALVVMLVRVNQHSKKLNRILANQNHVILDQKEQLSALNKTKDKLFSIIGHDLRSPINSLRGLMDLMDNASLSQDEFIHYSKNLKNNVNAVSADLTNLLSWAQSQQKGLSATFEDLHLHKEVVEKIELYREALKVKSLQLVNKIDFTIVISADKNHLGIIIRNLIGNAIKFSVNGGTINLSSNVLKDLVEVTVSDAGIGMSPEELGKLFNPTKHFSKTGTNQEKGLGLGLLLVKEFVELNNGTIRVESAPGKGSSFTFSLQLKSVKGLIAPL